MKFDVVGEDIKTFLLLYNYKWEGYSPSNKTMFTLGLPKNREISSSKYPLRIRVKKDDKSYIFTLYVTPVTFSLREFAEENCLDFSSEWKNFLLNKYPNRYSKCLLDYFKEMSTKLSANFKVRQKQLMDEIRREQIYLEKEIKNMKNEINDCFKKNKIDKRV